jgi:hypothetical protein
VLKTGFHRGQNLAASKAGWDGGGWSAGRGDENNQHVTLFGSPLPALGRGEIQLFRNCLTSFYFGIFMQPPSDDPCPPLDGPLSPKKSSKTALTQ